MNEEAITVQNTISHQRKSIDALLSITNPKDESLSIENIATRAIETIKEITGFRTVTFRIYNPQEECFTILAQSGMTAEMIKQLYRVRDDGRVFKDIMEKKEPTQITPIDLVRNLGFKRTLFIPLVAGEMIVGSIDLPTKTDYCPDHDAFRWFALVGRMLGSMVYQVQQTERLQNLAVMQERNRLVNELHDDFAQCVRSMEWGLDEARTALKNDQLEQADGILENLGVMVQNTSTYLREEMLGLREKIDSDRDLLTVISGMLSRFERNWGIKTDLIVENSVDYDHKMFLTPKVEVQLIRIIQEALMNIRRHSNASMATIEIVQGTDGIVLAIIDNGIGFYPENVPAQRLGLRVIHERATSIGAMMAIDSIEGSGTTLKITLPSQLGTLL